MSCQGCELPNPQVQKGSMGKAINMIELLGSNFSAHHSVSISHFSYAQSDQR